MNKKLKKLGLALVFLLPFSQAISETPESKYSHILKVVSIADLIYDKHVHVLSKSEIIDKLLTGGVGSLDPHSSFMTKEEYKDFKISSNGKFVGVGMVVEKSDGGTKVISPIDDTPAFKAGIKSGDLIVKIDSTPIHDMSLKNAVNMMRGVIDTKVKLTIIRKKETLVKTITRAVINIIAVKDLILDESTGYIRISSFTSTSANDFRKSLISISDKGINSIIIDLRDNPGGQLGQVSDITDLLLPKGLNIVTTKSRNSDYSFDSEEDPIIPDLNLVILVNHGSASASEILAGAIQDHKMGIIAGVKTYGKGSVQTLFPMISGDAVKITTSLYYTPNGTSIQAKGISPDVIFKNFILDKESKNKPLFSEEDLQGRIDNPTEENPKVKSSSNVKTKTTEKIKKMNSDPYIIQAKGLLKSLELK